LFSSSSWSVFRVDQYEAIICISTDIRITNNAWSKEVKVEAEFWGSNTWHLGADPDPHLGLMDPDPSFVVSDLQEANKK
jgi:hypothetical protein